MPVEDDATLTRILKETKTIAVVGASAKPWRDSNSISEFLLHRGYSVIPVNPNYKEVLGKKCYPTLQSVPGRIDLVDVFRNPEGVEEIVESAVEIKAKAIWLQLGVVHPRAVQKAEQAGLTVVIDRCIAVDYRRLMK
ncbi:MAG: CoA-binding protein [Bacteroidota bacterium]